MLTRRDATKAIATLTVGTPLIECVERWLAPEHEMPSRNPLGNIGTKEIERIEQATHLFREWDDHFGGGLRRKAVVCYGMPFYAGWGLTKDILSIPRRTRRLTLDELVAGALICYPAYVRRSDGKSSTPEGALNDLLAWRATGFGRFQIWRDLWRRAIRLVVGAA